MKVEPVLSTIGQPGAKLDVKRDVDRAKEEAETGGREAARMEEDIWHLSKSRWDGEKVGGEGEILRLSDKGSLKGECE